MGVGAWVARPAATEVRPEPFQPLQTTQITNTFTATNDQLNNAFERWRAAPSTFYWQVLNC